MTSGHSLTTDGSFASTAGRTTLPRACEGVVSDHERQNGSGQGLISRLIRVSQSDVEHVALRIGQGYPCRAIFVELRDLGRS